MKIYIEKGTINGEEIENVTIDIPLNNKNKAEEVHKPKVKYNPLVCDHHWKNGLIAIGDANSDGERMCNICRKEFRVYEPDELSKLDVEKEVLKAKKAALKSLKKIRDIIHSEMLYQYTDNADHAKTRKYQYIDEFFDSLDHLPGDWEIYSKRIVEMYSRRSPSPMAYYNMLYGNMQHQMQPQNPVTSYYPVMPEPPHFKVP